MRRVTRSYTRKPRILKDPATLADLEQIASTANAGLISQKIYFDPYTTTNGNRSKVLDKLAIWYKGKCAYCERLYKLDVEHFRPKGRITDENNKVLAASGYYWLCYEWSNLLPSCISCNREGGKVDKFPILGIRVVAPIFRRTKVNKSKCLINSSHFIAERPILLNPEVDNPAAFFSFKINDSNTGIEIVGTDADNRGKLTQQICKLNREELQIERVQVVLKPFTQAVHSLFKLYQIGDRTQAEVKQELETLIQTLYDQAKDVELTHTLLRSFIVHNHSNFNTIVIPFLQLKVRATVLTAFKSYTPRP